jgi:hypothetical protein
VNGSAGIAVGMATNVPPHNLREVIGGCVWLIENTYLKEDDTVVSRNDKIKQLISLIPGPDFPTAGYIVGLLQGLDASGCWLEQDADPICRVDQLRHATDVACDEGNAVLEAFVDRVG